MTKHARALKTVCALMLVLALAGCRTSRAVADKKLAKACEAAVSVLLQEGDEMTVTDQSFEAAEAHDGSALRKVTLTATLIHDGGRELDRTYECSFTEEFGPAGFGWNANYHSITKDGATYGNVGGNIEGDLTDHMKITNAVDGILKN